MIENVVNKCQKGGMKTVYKIKHFVSSLGKKCIFGRKYGLLATVIVEKISQECR
jgi:hypothetical protein